MKLTIRERAQKVFQAVMSQGSQTIRAIAKATGFSKSSVHRYQQAMARRNQNPESFWMIPFVNYHTHEGMWLVTRLMPVTYGRLTSTCSTD
jgi:hypothetical protein